MAYMTKGLGKMQVMGRDGKIITLKERSVWQIKKYMLRYMRKDELKKYSYVKKSQYVSENNGYTYAIFRDKKGYEHAFCIYNNPKLK